MFLNQRTVYTPSIIGVLTVVFGLLYIPAFMYGYFWLWVFPFTGLATILLRCLLDNAVESVSVIEDIGRRSWAMSRRLFALTIIQVIACAFPFILALWLYALGFIAVQEASAIDKSLYDFVLSFLRDHYLPKKGLDFSDGVVPIILACSYFMFISLLLFAVFGFRKAAAARKVVFNNKFEAGDPRITFWGKNKVISCWEFLISSFLYFVFLFSVEEVLIREYSHNTLSFLLIFLILFSVFTTTYTISRFFIEDREIKR
ncbi:MAG: hypothetical protein COA45_04200 [Zetaproteobacteria bacterium]|nr:MAG: hypothetical protein COA45_04200 [Zetaproteobacteria bacterium]